MDDLRRELGVSDKDWPADDPERKIVFLQGFLGFVPPRITNNSAIVTALQGKAARYLADLSD